MAQGKYIGLFVVLLFSIIYTYSTFSYASTWIPEEGEYKVYSSFGFIDQKSEKDRKKRKQLSRVIQNEINELKLLQNKIIEDAENEAQGIQESDSIYLEYLDNEINKLEESLEGLNYFTDEQMAYFEIEYGISSKNSFGLNLGYTVDEFINASDVEEHKIGKSIDIFFKQKIYDKNNFIITIQPKFHYSSSGYFYDDHYLDLAIMFGHSKQKPKYNFFKEIGMSVRKITKSSSNKKNILGFTNFIQSGMKFNNGFMIVNYSQVEMMNSNNSIYSQTFYDQVSIAKQIYFDSLALRSFTVQLGYFWKGSLKQKHYTISGPIFSLCLTL